jgi:hypothetical protein
MPKPNSGYAPVITCINKVRFVDDIMIYWTTERIFPRQTLFESLWFETDGNLLCFYYFFLKRFNRDL